MKLKTALSFLKTVGFYAKRPWFWVLRSVIGKALFVLFLWVIIGELPDLLMGWDHRKSRALRNISDAVWFFSFAIIFAEVFRLFLRRIWRNIKENQEQRVWNQELKARLIFEEDKRIRYEEERPERLEKELSEIKEQLRRMSNAKPAPPPKSTFTGSIKTEQEALELLEISKPFTSVELKKRRNALLQKIHPDKGGSGMMARLVNDAYEILKDRI